MAKLNANGRTTLVEVYAFVGAYKLIQRCMSDGKVLYKTSWRDTKGVSQTTGWKVARVRKGVRQLSPADFLKFKLQTGWRLVRNNIT